MTWNNINNARINRTTITRKQKWEEKQLNGYFKRQTSKILHEETWIWLRKENLERKTEFHLIAAPNNTIWINHVKAKIDKTQQNSKCRLHSNRDETFNHIISGCRKLAQKSIRLDMTGRGKWSTWNCARNWNLTIWKRGISTTRDPS